MTSLPAVEIDRFSFAVGGKPILREVSFAVAAGEYLSVIGPNGAGKTTLLKCIDRLAAGGTGSIHVFGRPLERYRQRELARRISYVPQADGRLFPYTVHEFVLMGRYPHLAPLSGFGRDDRLAVDEAMEQAGVAAFARRRLATLSGGERQKVFVAAALAQGAEVLLLDEPTTFLDYRHQAEVRELLARLNRDRGTTVVAVTHDVNQAALDSHRVLALRAGAVAFLGPPAELMNASCLAAIYGTGFVLVDHPCAGLPIVVPRQPGGRP